MNKCIECGLLGLSKPSGDLAEASVHYRDSGEIPTERKKYIYKEAPVCQKRKIAFTAKSIKENFELACNSPDFECKSFTKYRPGNPPQEHEKMSLNAEMEVRQLRWEQQQQSLIETRHQELRKDVKTNHDEMMKSTRKRDWIVIAGIVVSVIAAILSAYATYLAGRTPQP